MIESFVEVGVSDKFMKYFQIGFLEKIIIYIYMTHIHIYMASKILIYVIKI